MFARSLLAARPVLRQAAPLGRRTLHVDNVIGNNTPFSYSSPKALATKMIAFCGLGFSIPFIACGYQLHKAAA